MATKNVTKARKGISVELFTRPTETDFRFVVEDVANKLRFAESVALTVVDALAHVEQPHLMLTLRHGANELTEAIGILDHAVENARLAGTRLVVPVRS